MSFAMMSEELAQVMMRVALDMDRRRDLAMKYVMEVRLTFPARPLSSTEEQWTVLQHNMRQQLPQLIHGQAYVQPTSSVLLWVWLCMSMYDLGRTVYRVGQ
jgi:hypothetical protein